MKRTQDEEEDKERIFQLGVFSLISSFSSRYFHIIFLFPFFFLPPLGFCFCCLEMIKVEQRICMWFILRLVVCAVSEIIFPQQWFVIFLFHRAYCCSECLGAGCFNFEDRG